MSRNSASAVPAVTLDPNLVRFEIRHGMRKVTVAVLDDALDAVSGQTEPSNASLRRRSFDRFRTLINAAAQLKLGKLPPEFAGPLMLTQDDLRRVPPERGVPSFGSVPRASNKPPAAVVETAEIITLMPAGQPANEE